MHITAYNSTEHNVLPISIHLNDGTGLGDKIYNSHADDHIKYTPHAKPNNISEFANFSLCSWNDIVHYNINTILVFGTTSFLGASISIYLKDSGYKVLMNQWDGKDGTILTRKVSRHRNFMTTKTLYLY